jgi:hypothetical protein
MKKIISICILCLCFTFGSMASSVIKKVSNLEISNVTSSMGSSVVNPKKIDENNRLSKLLLVCFENYRTTTVVGQDMYGNNITVTTIYYTCFDWSLTMG